MLLPHAGTTFRGDVDAPARGGRIITGEEEPTVLDDAPAIQAEQAGAALRFTSLAGIEDQRPTLEAIAPSLADGHFDLHIDS